MLAGELDPTKTTSTLGRALGELRNLLDADRSDSVQSVLARTVCDITADDGSLSRSVQRCVGDAIRPLSEQVERLGHQIAGADAVQRALQATTKKGAPYEEEVVAELQRWSAGNGAEIHHVGGDNRPGDVTVVLPSIGPDVLRIVIEVRDRITKMGRRAITETLEKAMAERGACAAIYLSNTSEGLAKEIGEWAEGECDRGPFVATIHTDLFMALRWLLAVQRLRREQESLPEVDRNAIEAQIDRVRTSLGRIGTISRRVGQIRTGTSAIEDEAESLRGEIRRALAGLEEALRSKGTESPPLVA